MGIYYTHISPRTALEITESGKHLALLVLICHNQRITAENVQQSNMVQRVVVLIMYDSFLLYSSDVNYQTDHF